MAVDSCSKRASSPRPADPAVTAVGWPGASWSVLAPSRHRAGRGLSRRVGTFAEIRRRACFSLPASVAWPVPLGHRLQAASGVAAGGSATGTDTASYPKPPPSPMLADPPPSIGPQATGLAIRSASFRPGRVHRILTSGRGPILRKTGAGSKQGSLGGGVPSQRKTRLTSNPRLK